MKLVSSLVRPERVDAVKRALSKLDVLAMTVVEARDHSPQSCEMTVWMGHAYKVDSSQRMDIRVVVHDDEVDQVIDVILRSARTGRTGDGHVCVMAVEHRYNIGTGWRDVS
jgi:nitrogen regulatory protein P-II 1